MLLHASLPISQFGKCPVGESNAADQIDFRNIFPDDSGMASFEGHGPTAEDRTRKMLERLAVRITREGEQSSGGGNKAIPAGYTYLGQLVSHDIVHSVPEGPDATDAMQPTRNMRVDRMILDTLYGRGPGTEQAPFMVPRRAGQARTRLRLGKCRMDGARPAGGPALDIPRIGCPEIDNLLAPGATETLLADPRNDVSLIMSQLTVVFHLLHNRIEAEVAIRDARAGRSGREVEERRFVKARKATAFLYRHIVNNDLMKRMLVPSAHARLVKALTTGKFLDDIDDRRMPLEFSHSAYRIGHSMVQSTYAVNDTHTFTGVKDIIRFTSSRRPFEMPLSSDWLVQWSRFFEMASGTPTPSRLIGPEVAPALGVNDLFPTQQDEYGGLVLRDLLRGAEAGLRSADSLIAKLDPADRTHPFLADKAVRVARIAEWLKEKSSAADGDPGFDEKDIEILSNDPPLLFFVLMEAQEVESGIRLGPVGSLIVGEVVYGALYKTKSMIEDDPETTALMDDIFAAGMPGTMPTLIGYLETSGDLPGA